MIIDCDTTWKSLEVFGKHLAYHLVGPKKFTTGEPSQNSMYCFPDRQDRQLY